MSPTEIIAAKEAYDGVKNIFVRLFGPAIDQYGLMFEDNVKVRRLKNQIKNVTKINKIVEEEKISIKAVDLKALVPYMESVSLEENESLQDMWAKLMVNYLDSSKNLSTHVYPSIMAQLSTVDVEILELMVNNMDTLNLKWSHNIKGWDWKMLINLERLALVREDIDFKASYTGIRYDSPKLEIEPNDTGHYILTQFGSDFMEACTRKSS
jgi:hypothetical protein